MKKLYYFFWSLLLMALSQNHCWSWGWMPPEVTIQETATQIEIRIPLEHPEEAKGIQIHIQPHSIGVERTLPIFGFDGKTRIGSSSFSRSMPIQGECCLANSKKQRFETKTMLLITFQKNTIKGAKLGPSKQAPAQPIKRPSPVILQKKDLLSI
jgi:hypothetical protein